jgi:hypothetical protein
MKKILLCATLVWGSAAWGQSGAYAPVDIVQSGLQQQQLNQNASVNAAQSALLRQQTELLKQQTEALKQQNELLKQRQQAMLLSAQAASPANPKPKIDDIEPITKQPKYTTYAEYEDAKDEWLIEEAVRRFEARRSAAATQKKEAQ